MICKSDDYFKYNYFQQLGDMIWANKTLGVPLSHPINIAQLFIPYALYPTDITYDFKVPGLAKLLHFSNFVKIDLPIHFLKPPTPITPQNPKC